MIYHVTCETMPMKNRIVFILAVFLSTMSFASVETAVSPESRINNFAFDLYRQVSNPDQNVILSPYSLSTILSKLIYGSSGQTRDQLLKLFKSDNIKDANTINAVFEQLDRALSCSGWLDCHLRQIGKYFKSSSSQFEIADAFWADTKFGYKNAFLNKFTGNSFISFNTLDFSRQPEQARITINDWVMNKTHHRINDLLAQGTVDTSTAVILTNAIYFEGTWSSPFQPRDTNHHAIFSVSDDTQGQVDMMFQENKFKYADVDSLLMLQLDYKDSPLAMAVLLPKTGYSVNEILKSLTAESFIKLINDSKVQTVDVYLPKFDIKSEFDDLQKSLMSLGMTDAFTGKANFSLMTDSPLYISKVIQKAIINVDEQGTVASAATAAVVLLGSAVPEYPVFNADHPFIYIIFDKQTNVILFMGQFTRPGNIVKCGKSCKKNDLSSAPEGIMPFKKS